MSMQATDPVTNPAHYTRGGMSADEIIEALLTPEEQVGFWYGNLIKYVFRWPTKGQTPTERKRDLEKAKECAERTIKAYDALDDLNRKKIAELIMDRP